jgi:hypothetical protein
MRVVNIIPYQNIVLTIIICDAKFAGKKSILTSCSVDPNKWLTLCQPSSIPQPFKFILGPSQSQM